MSIGRKYDMYADDPTAKPLYIPDYFVADPLRRYVAANSPAGNDSPVTTLANMGSAAGSMYSNTESIAPIKRKTFERQYLEFDGSVQWMQAQTSDASLANGPYTLYAVAQLPDAGAATIMAAGGGGNGIINRTAGGNLQAYRGSTVNTTIAIDDDWHVFLVVFDGANSVLRMDGQQITGDLGTNTPASMEVGRTASTSGRSKVNLAEWGSFPRALSSSDRNSLVNSLREAYIITATS